MIETKSDEILARAARYQQKEKVSDKWGRIISVQRLKQSQMERIQGFTSDLQGVTKVEAPGTIIDPETGQEVTNPDAGKESSIPRNWRLILAAHVREINDNPIPFPKNREELDAILDRLDDEGIEAAATGFSKLMTHDEPPADVIEEAKNVVRTPRPVRHSA